MKNKIHNYDFLIIGAGLIGSLTALELLRKNFKVLIVEKSKTLAKDKRTLAVNANSRNFLDNLGLWKKIKNKIDIKNIVITDTLNPQMLEFTSPDEAMGAVIYNAEILNVARKELLQKKVFTASANVKIDDLKTLDIISINKKKYKFKKIIFALGKNINSDTRIIKREYNQGHKAYVGFFDHIKSHENFAYEFFSNRGPLAVLPAPSINKKKSTFIYSSNDQISSSELKKLIIKNFSKSHGSINFENQFYTFPILPHLSITKDLDIILIGDSLRSIHPVAGQGWNLGVKDINTLSELTDLYSLEDSDFVKNYYARRKLDSILYLGFTSVLNNLYENQNPAKQSLIKLGFQTLRAIPWLKNQFIRQAMGKISLI